MKRTPVQEDACRAASYCYLEFKDVPSFLEVGAQILCRVTMSQESQVG
jgi:hypothetical protein